MKEILALLINRILVVSLAGCSNQRDSSQTAGNSGRKVRIMIGCESSPGESIDLACREWKRLMEERSGGTMRVELYPSNQLGSKDSITDQTVNENYMVALVNGPFFQDRGTQNFDALFTPYLFEGWGDLDKVVNSDWFDSKTEELEQNVELKVLTTWRCGTRRTITKKPVNVVSDLKGRKIRAPNQTILIRVSEPLGATLIPMAMSGIYTALQQGTIGGAENPFPVILNGAHQEVAKDLILSAHTYDMTCWIVEADYFHTLTEQRQNVLMKRGDQAGVFNSQQLERVDEEALEILKEAGVTVSELMPEDSKIVGQAFYEGPQIKAMWSEGLIEEMKTIIGGQD